MKNLEQIRAAAALETAKNTSKSAVSKLPALILSNGLLAAAAFASEKKKDGQTPRRREMKAVVDGAARHLANPEMGFPVLKSCADAETLIRILCVNNSADLQRATSETVAFIGYVKRFTTKAGTEDGDAE